MTSVIKVQNLAENTSLGDLRRAFKDRGARPADIHITPSSGDKPRTGFIVFRERKEADVGLRADGTECRGCRLIVKPSNPKEFDRMFPGKPMLSDEPKNKPLPRVQLQHGLERSDRRLSKDDITLQPAPNGVVKVDNIEFSASPRDIRRLFKDHDARPHDIHLVLQPNGSKHDGSAFLIFTEEAEASNALKLDGTTLSGQRLSVKSSSPKEFNRFFPRVAMLSARPANNNRGGGRGGGAAGMGRRGGSPPPMNMDRGRGGHSARGGRGGRAGGFAGGRSADQFFGGRQDNGGGGGRVRSRSPINRGGGGRRDSNVGDPFDRRRANHPEPTGPINERNFIRISGLPFNASQVDIQEFLRPILTRDIFIMRNVGGKYAGKFNGNALIEFFSEGDARQALKMDGSNFGNQKIQVVRASREEIMRTIHESRDGPHSAGGAGAVLPPESAISAIAQSNPQVQNLLNLLTATVNTIAGAAAAAVTHPPKPDTRNAPRGGDRGGHREDPVISRVASSANVNVNDIKLGRVIGLRNLPYSVSPEEILSFFRNYKVIADSVRIHYLEDGRCSGDAIVCFRGNRDARAAVSDLNKRMIGRRKVELFFL